MQDLTRYLAAEAREGLIERLTCFVRSYCHAGRFMSARRQELLRHLEAYYRGCGWPVERADDGTVRARGPGSVTWIGIALVTEDFGDPTLPGRLVELSDVRMPGTGERCPLELLPADECITEARALLVSLGLADLVSVYALAPAA